MSLERRATYRIVYPQEARPVFVCDGESYAVSDVSEHGLRVEVRPEGPAGLGDDVGGTVRFRSGAELKIEGTIVRVSDGWAALRLAERLPFAVVIAEQRLLRSRYPMWERKPTDDG